jgi:hypothetical protein
MESYARAAAPAPQFQEESLFEYHLYTLQRRADIRDQQTKQVSFFTADKVAVEKEYTFRAQPHYFVQGFQSLAGTEHVDVTLRFKNTKANGLGDPIPPASCASTRKIVRRAAVPGREPRRAHAEGRNPRVRGRPRLRHRWRARADGLSEAR